MFSAPQIASSKIQNANGARASTDPAGCGNPRAQRLPMAQITTAVITIMTADKPVRAQRHAERRRPPAEQIDERTACPQHGDGDRAGDREARAA